MVCVVARPPRRERGGRTDTVADVNTYVTPGPALRDVAGSDRRARIAERRHLGEGRTFTGQVSVLGPDPGVSHRRYSLSATGRTLYSKYQQTYI